VTAPPPVNARRVIVAGLAGNVMEWYDFAVYGYFAGTIGRHFFPAEDKTASLISAFGVFAAGFLMRPLGGVVFGHVGDRFGRNAALISSVLAMAVPTVLIGLLPGYDALGPAAAVLLVFLRMLQGLAVGGEFTTSIVYLIEAAPPGRRGRLGSWGPFGATAGILLGSGVGALAAEILDPADLAAWGWRIPFLVGLPLALIGLGTRRHLPEPAAPAGPKAVGLPLFDAVRTEWRAILRVAALNAVVAVGFYLAFVYAVTWLEVYAHLGPASALDINTASMVVLLLAIPAGGALSDRYGRRPLLVGPAAATALLAVPLFRLMHTGVPGLVFAGQAGFAVLIGLFAGANPAAMAEAVPARVRCTAVSVAYNLCVGLLGGLTPMAATVLIEWTHDDLSPAFALAASAVVSAVAAWGLKPARE
jgi:MHS family proline/betaine transporter-like MFS transporter